MFFSGSLQEGISTALQQNKLVVCFVTDEGTESKQWENDFLQSSPLTGLLKDEAVLLRLKAGSEEAGYLAAIFPIPKVPTLVIIKNGELKEYITAGVAKKDFVRRLSGAFGDSQQGTAAASSSTAPPVTAPAAPANQPGDDDDLYGDDVVPQAAPVAQSSTSSSSPAAPPPTDSQTTASRQAAAAAAAARTTQLAAVREAAEKKWKDARAQAKGKQKADAEAAVEDSRSKDPAWLKRQAETKKHSDALRKKQQEALDERQRVLRRIEDDKAERRLRATARAEERQVVSEKAAGDEAKEGMSSGLAPSRTSTMASIQARLFDGSTIRSRFPSSATLRTDVRAWVDAERGAERSPYTFKVVLTPMPNRNIEETEEDKSLLDLSLAPSATLLLLPMTKQAAAAYPHGAGGSAATGILGQIIGFFMGLLSMVVAFFSSFAGGRPASEPAQGEASSGEASGSRPEQKQDGTRIRGFQNRADRQKDYQLYNGNSLNFEPRPDDKEEDE